MNVDKLIIRILYKVFKNVMGDSLRVKLSYYINTGTKLSLSPPVIFSEKLQYLKIHDKRSLYTILVDKHKVKEYVSSLIGEEYIIPTLGVYKKFHDIDFSRLPKQFVIKCTHDSGGVVICKDFALFDKMTAEKKIRKCLKRNFYKNFWEYPYKLVPPRIIIEQYMEGDNASLRDYKFFCFSGKVKLCQVISDRFSDEKIDFFDTNWNRINGLIGLIGLNTHAKNSDGEIHRPVQYEKMIQIAEKLSHEIPFVRIDLYDIKGKIYFGECTFFPAAGYGKFFPEEWNYIIGNWIDLDEKRE